MSNGTALNSTAWVSALMGDPDDRASHLGLKDGPSGLLERDSSED